MFSGIKCIRIGKYIKIDAMGDRNHWRTCCFCCFLLCFWFGFFLAKQLTCQHATIIWNDMLGLYLLATFWILSYDINFIHIRSHTFSLLSSVSDAFFLYFCFVFSVLFFFVYNIIRFFFCYTFNLWLFVFCKLYRFIRLHCINL